MGAERACSPPPGEVMRRGSRAHAMAGDPRLPKSESLSLPPLFSQLISFSSKKKKELNKRCEKMLCGVLLLFL